MKKEAVFIFAISLIFVASAFAVYGYTYDEDLIVNGKIDVNGPENTGIDIKTGTLTLRQSVNSAAGAQFGTVTDHDLNLFTSNMDRLTILSDGKVGIGTDKPDALLDVRG